MTKEEKEEQDFLAKKAKESEKDDSKADAKKGKEPWRYKHVSGKEHPDNKPPVTIIAQASDEATKKYEDSINAELEKQYGKPDEVEEESKEDKK